MKNILMLTTSGKQGGVEKITHTLWKELRKYYSIKVLKISVSNEEVYLYGEDEIRIGNKNLREKNKIRKIYRLIKDTILITYYKKKYKIDLTISIGEMATLLNGLSLDMGKKIGSIHGEKVKYRDKITKIISDISFKRLNRILCISEAIKEETLEILGQEFKKKVKVIYNPHDYEEIKKKANEKLEKNEEDIFFNKNVFIYVGRIDENKGLAHLVKIFKYEEKLKNKKLVIIGPEPENKIYKERLKELDSENVHYLGMKKNPYKYINKSKALLMCSYSEGMPNVLIESLILKVPVVTTKSTEGIFEIINKHNSKVNKINDIYEGDYGIVVDKFDCGSEFLNTITEKDQKYIDSMQKIEKIKIKEFTKKFESKNIIEKYRKEIDN
ncbi:glycosyltransferase [Cetobacterium somerae]|uniref:glycosyltransferase n=1 Tax=Cetobacterium somerae TaxID=188913 RepID=UPI002E7B4AFC|nr:glycosyltransferase [Cetobacterium somerae]WVJ00702.1 glycosyltransferase [Cetobacterium somerae]